MLKPIPVVVVYVYPFTGGQCDARAKAFVDTYKQLDGGYPHELRVVCNGQFPKGKVAEVFSGLPHTILQHDNSGWDIGAFQLAARIVPCELMVFFGNSTYIKRAGWLSKMVGSYLKYGPNLYGVMGHTGDGRFQVHPHIRTTGFWMPPSLFNLYPIKINRPQQRYGFEHGPECLTNWVISIGLKAYVVGWSGEYGMGQWGSVPNGYHNGDQTDLLVGDRLTAPPYYHTP